MCEIEDRNTPSDNPQIGIPQIDNPPVSITETNNTPISITETNNTPTNKAPTSNRPQRRKRKVEADFVEESPVRNYETEQPAVKKVKRGRSNKATQKLSSSLASVDREMTGEKVKELECNNDEKEEIWEEKQERQGEELDPEFVDNNEEIEEEGNKDIVDANSGYALDDINEEEEEDYSGNWKDGFVSTDAKNHHVSIPLSMKHRCEVCGKAFLLESSFELHIRRIHYITVGEYKRALTTMVFPSHTVINSQKASQVKDAPEQEKMKTGRKKGQKARKLDDPGVELLTCPMCEKKYITTKALWKHMESIHSQQPGFEKSIMDLEFTMAKRRMKVAPEVECSLCQQMCIGNQVLVHLKKWHHDHPDLEKHLTVLHSQLTQEKQRKMFANNPQLKEKQPCHRCGKMVS